ncbi:type II toxin-antitoxin system VapC family toxin [Rhizobium sp. TRM95111]|uniref:type II toxin-antitoxin system VapC family toxin n=1 Tax=Rhizobium alarense TaxID=2846851 RepID=UPI001F33ABF2|nr:type II toxin-antitoxin system VapC family toxin [Rhizobium alarense]MCF3641558.1 type II toxin-antitoxin system VapC family toxin [Rhizobium alarense]
MNVHRYMLDTNIVSDMVRNPEGVAVARGKAAGAGSLCLSAVTVCELRFGVKKKGATTLSDRVEAFLSTVPAIPLEPEVSERFAEIRYDLERKGTPIGPFDMLIAAHALSLDLTLVTANIREFSRVEGLKVENWMEAAR